MVRAAWTGNSKLVRGLELPESGLYAMSHFQFGIAGLVNGPISILTWADFSPVPCPNRPMTTAKTSLMCTLFVKGRVGNEKYDFMYYAQFIFSDFIH